MRNFVINSRTKIERKFVEIGEDQEGPETKSLACARAHTCIHTVSHRKAERCVASRCVSICGGP